LLSDVWQARADVEKELRAGEPGPAGAARLRRAFDQAVEAETVTSAEAQRNIVLLLVAGTVTTRCAIANTLRAVMAEPAVFADLRAGALTAGLVVAETLRHDPPLHFTTRFATCDTTLAGVTIPRGAPLQVCLASANRDEDVFENPDVWDPHRESRSPPMTFGSGRHLCPGNTLGEHEAVILLEELQRRYTSIHPAAELPPTQGWMLRAPTRLVAELLAGTS
jgi:cytochrome P450